MSKPTRWQLFLDKVPPPLRNKYIFATTVFVVWMFIFDRNSIWSQYKLQTTLHELQQKKIYFEREIKNDTEAQRELLTDDKSVEKFAREHHLMKKKDEVIFVFEQAKD
jgi:cell division protein DivIC